MHRRTTRLCEWANLVGADLPDEIACEHEERTGVDGEELTLAIDAERNR